MNMEKGKTSIVQTRKLVRIGGSIVVAIPPDARRLLGWRVGNYVRIIADENFLLMEREKGIVTNGREGTE